MFGAAGITDDVVRSAKAGSKDDLARLAEAVQPQVRLMIAARLSPRPCQFDAIDDLVQEVLTALTAAIGRIESLTVDGLRAYLSGVVSRQVALFIRTQDARPVGCGSPRSLDSTVASLSNAGPLWQFLSSSGTSPLSAAARAEQAVRLLRELGRLNDDYREVITLAFFDQLSPGEIGGRLGLSRGAASMLLIRAMRALRDNMSKPIATETAHGCGI